EALAAATEAYAEYQDALDHAFQDLDSRALDSYATDEALSAAVDSVADYAERGWRQEGHSSVASTSLVDATQLVGRSEPEGAQIYACLDVSDVEILDEQGNSVVSEGRPATYALVASLRWMTASRTLTVSHEEPW
ncbi:hypothetical protein KH400_21735, partial [Desertibacillus haloalkaliphilus]